MAELTSQTAAQQSLTDFLKKNLKHVYTQSRTLEFKGLAVPMWIAKVHAHTRYNGYREETRIESYPVSVTDERGGRRTEMRTRSYPVYIPVRGEFDEVLTYPILGRRHAVFFGLEELKKRAIAAPTRPLDVKVFLNQNAECLDVELEESEVKAVAESLAEDEHRARAQAMTTKLFDCYTEDQVLSSTLVFYPIYVAKYAYRDKSFRVTLDGTSGVVAKAELPMTLGLRIGYAILGYAGVGLAVVSGLLWNAVEPASVVISDILMAQSLEEIVSRLVPPLAGILLPAALTVWSFLKATSEQRIKKG